MTCDKKLFFIMFGTRISIRNVWTYIPKCRLRNKIAVVTGATDGIGFAIARRLGLEGAKLVISSRNHKNVCTALKNLTFEGICATGVVCHVGKSAERKALFTEAISKYGAIDILVLNAGSNTPKSGSVLKCGSKLWDNAFDVNVKSSFFLAKECVPQIAKQGGGSIIFISALAGLHPFKNLGMFSITKTAVIGLTKALSIDLGAYNINVNSVAPGIIKTKFSKQLWNNKELSQYYLENIPLKRFGTPDDVADTVAFIASEDGKYVSGETIVAAGGMQSRL